MKPYRYPQARNIYFGDGVAKTMGTIVLNENINKVLVITDKFLFDSGKLEGSIKSLEESKNTTESSLTFIPTRLSPTS